MARNAEAESYTLNLWQRLVLWAYIVSLSSRCIICSIILDLARLCLCSRNAVALSARSAWLDSTTIPDNCYLPSHVNTLFQPLYILATTEAIWCPVCTVAFSIAIFRRDTTHNEGILVLGLIAISTVVAAVVLALQIVVQESSLDMQAILRIRPDLSSGEVLSSWNSFVCGSLSKIAFILFLLRSGFQIVAVSGRHSKSSSKRLPKQFRPFIMEKQKRTSAIGELEASTMETELVIRVDSGSLARLYDDYEKQGLISTHIDLEVCHSNIAIVCRYLHALHSLLTQKTLRTLK